MSKKKLLFENIFIYGFSNIVSKIIPFVFLPIVLILLDSPSDYAIYTSFITIVGLGTPLVTFGMHDAVFREYFEYEDVNYKNKVLSTALVFIVFTSIFVSILILLNLNFIGKLFVINDVRVILLAISSIIFSGFNSVLSLPTRLKNERKTYVIINAFVPVILYLVSLFTLLLGFSFYGLIISSIFANFLTLTTYYFLNKRYFNVKLFSDKVLKVLLKIAVPLVPLFVIYWIYNSMDRIMIVNYLGLEDLGIYSVASKFGSISSVIYASIAGGFQHFSFSTMKESNQVQNNTKLLNLVLFIASFSFGLLIFFVDFFFKTIFPEVYLSASNSSLFLFLSPLLLLSFQIVANQFLIIRKSYILLISLILGLIANFLLNFLLIPIFGILGASFSTFASFFINLVIITFWSKKYKLIQLSVKLMLNIFTILALSFTLFFIDNYFFKTFLSILLLVSSFLLNFEFFRTFIISLKTFINTKIKYK